MVWKFFNKEEASNSEDVTTLKGVANSSSSKRTNAERLEGLKRFANQRAHANGEKLYTNWDGSTSRKPDSYKPETVEIPTKAEKEEATQKFIKHFLLSGTAVDSDIEQRAMLEASTFNVPYSMVLDRMKTHGS
ncbi:hypothetical protein N8865_01990 [Francisellaceae bacterium]|nr:hypothetical protein [Francisellaceae bacterium]